MPSVASLSIAEYLYAGSQYAIDPLKPLAPPSARPCEYCSSRILRLVRVSLCSDVRIWSNWTGVEVCAARTVSPSPSSGLPGVPGLTSTKKLPSRKMRGRIAKAASLWIGRPLGSMRSVTSASSSPLRRWRTVVTLPTLTPAIRTGEFGRMLFAVLNSTLIA